MYIVIYYHFFLPKDVVVVVVVDRLLPVVDRLLPVAEPATSAVSLAISPGNAGNDRKGVVALLSVYLN